MKKLLPLVMAALLLSSCASYHTTHNDLPAGYHEKTLSPIVVLVSYTHQSTDVKPASRYAMKRAAEVTLERGYTYFTILKQRNYLDKSHGFAGSAYVPRAEIKIKFSANKTAKTYDAYKVLATMK